MHTIPAELAILILIYSFKFSFSFRLNIDRTMFHIVEKKLHDYMLNFNIVLSG